MYDTQVAINNKESFSWSNAKWKRIKAKQCFHEIAMKEAKKSMLKMNVENGDMRGVLKRGDEVIEVKWNRKENEVELMIVNVLNHSMRILKGLKGEELNEMDLSELVENEIVDLNDDGMRWEGEVLKGDLFGYGCLYDEENELEYEGWMIEGKKRCYGIEYWNDIGLKKYCGCYYDGLKNGYGLLYDRNGMIEHDGYFKDDKGITVEKPVQCECYSYLCLYGSVDSVLIANKLLNPAISSCVLNCPLVPLKRLEIGAHCFETATIFVINGLNELESVVFRMFSFHSVHNTNNVSKCSIMNCDRLREVQFDEYSFRLCQGLELKNLPSLISIQLKKKTFYKCQSITFESMDY